MADPAESIPVIALTAAVGAVILLLVLVCGAWKKGDESKDQQEEEEEESIEQPKGQGKNQKKPKAQTKRKEPKHAFTHPWLAGSLKMHSAPILGMDFSPNGKYLITCAEDRTLLLWSTKEITNKEHRSIRGNVDLDHATSVKFSPDNKAVITSLHNENTIRIFRLGKKAGDSSAVTIQAATDFPKKHKADIINIGVASSGKFIMTCSSDTSIKIWDLKGEVLSNIDTLQVNNSYAAVSYCGRFVGSAGFTSEVKVWEVCFDKVGNFKEVVRAFELKDHKAGVLCFDFNSDSSKMASVSKDGTWKYWDTNVEYKKGQDPRLLQTGSYTQHGTKSKIALSPNGTAVAVGSGRNVEVFNTNNGDLAVTFEDTHTSTLSIPALQFSLSNKFLAVIADRHIQVFHNIPGYKATIEDLEAKRKKAPSQAQKERIQHQINEAKEHLQELESGSQPNGATGDA